MSKFSGKLVLGLLLCFASAMQVSAQFHPLPGSKSEQPVLCSGCKGVNSFGQANDGLPTYPYDAPLVDFVGRYVDSSNTIAFQHVGIRTVRAGHIRVADATRGSAPPRVYIGLGEAVGAYSLSSFFTTKLPGGMQQVNRISTGGCYGCRAPDPLEKVAVPDGFLYPEATSAKWLAPFQDGQSRLFDFDWDDRGNLYAAYSVFGWGIVKDDGGTAGNHFPKVVQKIGGGTTNPANFPNTLDDSNGISSPKISLAFRNGAKYYVLIGDLTSTHVIYDTTDATTPRQVVKRTDATKKFGIRKWDRHDDSARAAYIGSDGKLYVWSYADLASTSGAALATFTSRTGGFADVSFDESGDLWAVEGKTNLWKLEAVGGNYNPIVYTPFGGSFDPAVLDAGSGHIAVAGVDRVAGAYDVRILKMESGGPTAINTDNFFMKYYHTAPQGYAEACVYCGIQADIQVVKHGGKTYLMYSVFGLGDVFEIQGSDSIHLTKKTNYGTVNPNAPSDGPFIGDIVTFTANSSSATTSYDVTYDFGNPESTDNTAGPKKTGLDVTHQYTGLTSASAITAPKTVRAVTIQDSTIASQMALSLKVPTPRVAISGSTTPFTANASNLEVLAGSTFKDASDGSVESHFGTWTLDTVPTKFKPNATNISVGTVGPHTMKFRGSYGKYDPTTLEGTSLYNTPELTLNYTVKPFLAVLNAPTIVGNDVRFSGKPEFTTDTTILSAAQWTVTWTFNAASAGGVSTQAASSGVPQTVPVGTIPTFEVPTDQVTSGSTVTLLIHVDPVGLSTPAAPYTDDSASMTLTTPDPLIEQAGCGNAGSDCEFTAKSVGGGSISDWTLSWTLKRGTSVVGTSSAVTYEPTVNVAGDYTITLKAKKSIFEKEVSKNFTVAQSLCGALPQSHQVAINKAGCASSCAPGTTITFSPSFNGYSKQACDTITWTFGDGTTGSGTPVQKSYTSGGTYNVQMKISNTNGSMTETTTVTITGGGTDNPGNPGNSCTAPTTATFSWAGSIGCAPGSNCRTTEVITFTPRRGSLSLQNCDTVSWNFGDNTTSTQRTPTKQYSAPGTYTVTLVVTNSQGSQTVTRDVVVVTPPAGTCTQAPTLGNFAIAYTGGTSACSTSNPTCQHGETVSFNAQSFQYAVNTCDTFTWDFGDGTTGVTGRTPTHVFTGNLTEYAVKVKVSNNAGNYTYTKTVKFVNTAPAQTPPVLTRTTFPGTGHKGKPITFVATSDMDTTSGWTWSFGDGTPNNTSQAGQTMRVSTMTHTFATPGTYTVKVSARHSAEPATVAPSVTQANIVITDPPAIPEYRYLLPSTAYLETGNWRTDVQIYNPDPQVSETKPLIMEATFKGKTYPLEMIKSTHIYEDFLGGLLSHQRFDQGPVIITTKNVMAPPQIWTRTYSNTAGGTYGQFVPAIRLDNVGGSGAATADGAYFLSGLRQDTRYRTNIGLLNPNDVAMSLTVKVYDAEGFPIGEFPVTLQPFALDQFLLAQRMPQGKPLPTDAPFSVKIDVPPAQWLVAYASFIDGMSSDPVYLQAVRDTDVTSTDYKKSVIPGVGHTGNWRSDVTIFNPDRTGMQFDLRYYDASGAKKGEALSVRLGAGEFLQYGDILKQGVLGNVGDGIGTLEVEVKTDQTVYPMTFARTFFDDLANGTYGQGIGGFAPARSNVKPNKPAFIAGVRNSATYYTNFGLLNVSSTAVVAKITLLDPTTGAAVNSVEYPLAPFQTVVGQYGGFGNIQTGTFKIEANGNVWAFASIIDKRTKDPEYVPAQ
jgi:PKD repeat protein